MDVRSEGQTAEKKFFTDKFKQFKSIREDGGESFTAQEVTNSLLEKPDTQEVQSHNVFSFTRIVFVISLL